MAEKIWNREINDFLNNEVKDYASYVIRTRALPNIMDGMRVGARKIIYAALTDKKLNPKDKSKITEVKMVNLIGKTMGLEFNHGDISLKNTIEQLAAKHYNKYSPLKIIGQTGTLRDPKIKTAARYLKVTRAEYLDFFDYSSEMLEYVVEENNKVEPTYFLPIIPISLLYRTNAPGFGFSYRSFSYKLDDIINGILSVLTQDSCTGLNKVPLTPEVYGIKDENIVYNSNIDAYFNVGEYEITARNAIKITDFPYNINFDAYAAYLFELKEKGVILEYYNKTFNGQIFYEIIFPTGRLEQLVKQKLKFFKLLKLYKKIPKNELNLIDVDGKSIINFSNENHLIEGFVKRRLEIYRQYRVLKIRQISKEIKELNAKIKFIDLIVKGEIEIRKRSKQDIIEQFKPHHLSEIEVLNNLKLPISRLTKEEIDKVLKILEQKEEELLYYKNTTINELYINDLIEFKNKYATKIQVKNVK